MSASRCLVVFLLPFSFLALSLCGGFFAAPLTCPPSDVDGVVEALRSPQQCPLGIERSFSDEVHGDTLDKELAHAQDGTYYSVFSYASWRPLSQKFRSIFDTLGSMFGQIRHLAVEQYSAMPSVFSRYGIHGFPAFGLTSRTASLRYHGLKDLDSSEDFYRELTGANMKNKKIMKKTRRESGISSLPSELLEEILLKDLAASPTPIREIRFFRQTCKNFHATCSSKRIGKYMNVEDWSMYWQDKQGYLGFLQSCATSENSNALFLLGLEKMFNQGKYDIGLHHLQLASREGHIISKYLMGLWWFRDDSFRSHGIVLLKEVSSNTHQCRKLASQIFSKMIWQKWPPLSFTRCEDLSCGTSTLEGDNHWLHEEQVERRFCSDVCKWAHEYKMFVNMRYLSAW